MSYGGVEKLRPIVKQKIDGLENLSLIEKLDLLTALSAWASTCCEFGRSPISEYFDCWVIPPSEKVVALAESICDRVDDPKDVAVYLIEISSQLPSATISLDLEDSKAFVNALTDPPKPNDMLKAAFERSQNS